MFSAAAMGVESALLHLHAKNRTGVISRCRGIDVAVRKSGTVEHRACQQPAVRQHLGSAKVRNINYVTAAYVVPYVVVGVAVVLAEGIRVKWVDRICTER